MHCELAVLGSFGRYLILLILMSSLHTSVSTLFHKIKMRIFEEKEKCGDYGVATCLCLPRYNEWSIFNKDNYSMPSPTE